MHFLPDPAPPEPLPARERRLWAFVLFGSAAATALATRWPWLRVKFEQLFSTHGTPQGLGPPGWQSTVGFTCLCASLLVAVMALAETGTPSSRQAVRPGSLLVAGIALLTLVFEGLQGPGMLRGVSATWTSWFYVCCVTVPALAAVCFVRWSAMPPHSR